MIFSVIIPVYNAEKYLSAAINSIISQTFDLRKIEIILINDGSTDKTEEICLAYKEKSKIHIVYEYIENSGPAKARNTGLKLVSEKSNYIIFLDADDKLENNAIEEANKFFLLNSGVKVATTPVYYFGRKQGSHRLNYRFEKGTRVIDISKEFNYPQYYIGGVFVDRSYLCSLDISFKETMSFWEDALFINKVITTVKKYGVLANTKYWYRRREDNGSLVDKAWLKTERYTPVVINGYMDIIEYSMKENGGVLPYVQFLIIYHLRLYLINNNHKAMLKTLNQEELHNFKVAIRELLELIDEKYILEQNIKIYQKEILLKLKYGNDYCGNNYYHSKNNFEQSIIINKICVRWLKLRIEGQFESNYYKFSEKDKLCIKNKTKTIVCKINNEKENMNFLGCKIVKVNNKFIVEIPLYFFSFDFHLKTRGGTYFLRRVNFFETFISKIKTKQPFK
ncbi:glycosyltransferase involved in cell wall biosynthesis [Cytobacillus horneckiae]|uniref:glycosyltransferase family A protein n=1 Tax=Cytobacillus horneckiae TaxID=549687 RepID=UPI0019D1128E|nr:glycosyltransferase family 2 protein [Cytobacillus horneckiae]MBN6885242.1 glycosyltransferase family 2 protein [Cytobacillus horneckiae]